MKKLLTLIIISIGFSQISSIGVGVGSGFDNLSISLGIEFDKSQYFGVGGGSNLFSGRDEDNTYEFSENLFDDEDRGKVVEKRWLVGGKIFSLNEKNNFYLGGGISIYGEYFKKFDSSEILSDDGNYYVTDDKSTNYKPTLYLGVTNTLSNVGMLKKVGFFCNLIPLDFSVILWI